MSVPLTSWRRLPGSWALPRRRRSRRGLGGAMNRRPIDIQLTWLARKYGLSRDDIQVFIEGDARELTPEEMATVEEYLRRVTNVTKVSE